MKAYGVDNLPFLTERARTLSPVWARLPISLSNLRHCQVWVPSLIPVQIATCFLIFHPDRFNLLLSGPDKGVWCLGKCKRIATHMRLKWSFVESNPFFIFFIRCIKNDIKHTKEFHYRSPPPLRHRLHMRVDRSSAQWSWHDDTHFQRNALLTPPHP